MKNGREVPKLEYYMRSRSPSSSLSGRTLRELVHSCGRHSGGSTGVLGAVLATFMRGLSNDVFFQVGLLTNDGLSAKNAILIVEFAKETRERNESGRSREHAAPTVYVQF